MDRWYAIFATFAMVAMFGSMAISETAKENAKRDIIVACYNAHQPNCDQLWGK